jgi:DNA-directed RNA polymerase specialized sigma24 family protein
MSEPRAVDTSGANAPTSLNIRDAMLKALSGVQRLVVLLWYAEQMTPAEIAQAVDMTPDQVERHHAEAIRILRDSVGLQAA